MDNSVTHYFFGGYDPEDREKNVVTLEDDRDKACGKVIENLETSYERFYIKVGKGQLFNPYDNDHLKARKGTFKYAQVSELCFKYYTVFLRTASQQYKTYAEREL